MMEVIPINTNEAMAAKTVLWANRIQAFQESGLSRKDWGQQDGIPPVAILLPGKIRIEVGPDCPARLMAALLQALKGHA